MRTALFPYSYTTAVDARATALPMMRHHLLSFPGDPRATGDEGSLTWMYGDAILAAPVVQQGARNWTVYLPTAAHGPPSSPRPASSSSPPPSSSSVAPPAETPTAVDWWYDVGSFAVFDDADGRWRVGYGAADAGVQPGGAAVAVDVTALDALPW